MVIRDVMSRSVVSVTPEESAALAARMMARHNLGALPVCGYDGTLQGIITDRDIVVRCIAADAGPRTVPVQDIMTRDVHSIAPDEEIHVAARRMASSQIRRLPVVENGKVVGMVALGDLAVAKRCNTEAADALCEISSNIIHKGVRKMRK